MQLEFIVKLLFLINKNNKKPVIMKDERTSNNVDVQLQMVYIVNIFNDFGNVI